MESHCGQNSNFCTQYKYSIGVCVYVQFLMSAISLIELQLQFYSYVAIILNLLFNFELQFCSAT